MLILNSNIRIDKYSFNRVNEVTITEDLNKIGTNATIKVPLTARLQKQGKFTAEVESAKAIKVGDKVTIQLGYNGTLKTEFEGFVRNIQATIPLSIIAIFIVFIPLNFLHL